MQQYKNLTKVGIGILIFSFLPIWRLAGTKSDEGKGLTLWEYFYEATRPEYKYNFITVEEAKARAVFAYEQINK